MMNYNKLLDATNSVSHLSDFTKYCLRLWRRKCDYGIYNVVNTDPVTTRQVTEKINKILKLDKDFKYFENEEEMYSGEHLAVAKTPRSNCVLDNSKLRATGIRVRSSDKAVEHALKNWQWKVEENEDSGIDKSFWK